MHQTRLDIRVGFGHAAWRASALLAAVSVIIFGCGRSGPPIAPVSGTVRLDGRPLEDGSVCFVSANYGASALLNPDGSFRLGGQYGKGIPLGTYRVAIGPRVPDPLQSMNSSDLAAVTKSARLVPANYQSTESSGLTAVVTADNHVFNFDLISTKQ